MGEHETRRESNDRKITDFLNSEPEVLILRLNPNEIYILSSRYPQIDIKQGSQYGNTPLFNCTITKK